MQRTLELIFRPLASLAMARGLRFSEVSEALRRAFLKAAQDEAGAAAPASRLSVMTGLQRRDIGRLLETRGPEPARDHSLTRLVAAWVNDADAAPLPQHGPAPSFDALARSIRQDVHPRSLLDVLLKAGTVELREGTVFLRTQSFVPPAGSEDQLAYLGENVGDHLAAAVGNVLGAPAAVELAAHYEGLGKDDVTRLHELWRARLRTALEEVSAEAAKCPGGGGYRFRAGGYFREDKS